MELRYIRCTFSDIGTLQHPARATVIVVGPLKGRAVEIIAESWKYLTGQVKL
jgi:hypothetical protein